MIRVGIGGWTFEPWRKTFYPDGLPHAQELSFASRHLTSIEVNGTFYRTQTPSTFEKWHDETPDEFVFALKAPRYATNRKLLAEAGASIDRFVKSGIDKLKEKLGPINWQFAPTKRFDLNDFSAFLDLLPKDVAGRRLRHAVEVRHESFQTGQFVDMARKHGVAIVVAGDSDYPRFEETTSDFIYSRIMGTTETERLGYSPTQIAEWASAASNWAGRGQIKGTEERDVYLYVISGFKERNPLAATAILEKLTHQAHVARR